MKRIAKFLLAAVLCFSSFFLFAVIRFFRLCGCTVVRLCGYAVVRLCGFTVMRLIAGIANIAGIDNLITT